MILTKDQLLNSIKEKFADDTSDETLKFIEDISDTFSNYETSDKENWKQKYEDNDKMWREKYRDRFFNTPVKEEVNENGMQEETQVNEVKTFDELLAEI